ncbi:MAG TPA: metallophosphoesterase [Vitreimonas sp.]|nr:metallophosphoesterase [Vitreimonas sp.]
MPRRRRVPIRLAVVAALVLVAALVAIALSREPGGPLIPTTIPPLPGGQVAVVVGAGDIAECGDLDDEATADLIDQIPGTVFAAGDTAYPNGSTRDFRECYEPSWGRFKERTRPVPGNHEYATSGAAGYLEYWGDIAAPDGVTWYAWDAGSWRVLMLDSQCGEVGGCGPESPQARWLRDELDASDARCTLAISHHPRFSSGFHGGDRAMTTFWQLLHEAGAELVVSAHDHSYERFAPQAADGRADATGPRQFVVGTGGGRLRSILRATANSEIREAGTFGVLRLALGADRYQWDFIPVAGRTFRDSGTGVCR